MQIKIIKLYVSLFLRTFTFYELTTKMFHFNSSQCSSIKLQSGNEGGRPIKDSTASSSPHIPCNMFVENLAVLQHVFPKTVLLATKLATKLMKVPFNALNFFLTTQCYVNCGQLNTLMLRT